MNNHPTATRRLRGAWLPLAAVFLLANCSNRPPQPPRPYTAWVANSVSGTVAVVDLQEMRILTSIAVPRPIEAKVRPENQEVWVLSATGTASVIGYPELRVLRKVFIGAEIWYFSTQQPDA